MSNPNMEAKVKELMELKRMREELDAEIAAAEDEIKKVMGDEETLFAGAFIGIALILQPPLDIARKLVGIYGNACCLADFRAGVETVLQFQFQHLNSPLSTKVSRSI